MERTPPPFAIQLLLGSLFILFLSIILFAKRGCSPLTLCGIKMADSKNKIISDLKERIEFFNNEYHRLKAQSVFENSPTQKFHFEQNMKEALKQKENAETLL